MVCTPHLRIQRHAREPQPHGYWLGEPAFGEPLPKYKAGMITSASSGFITLGDIFQVETTYANMRYNDSLQ